MFSGSSRFPGSNHSVIEDSDRRIGILSWIGARGSAASLVRIAKESNHLVGSSGFLVGSNHQSYMPARASMPVDPAYGEAVSKKLSLFSCLTNLDRHNL